LFLHKESSKYFYLSDKF